MTKGSKLHQCNPPAGADRAAVAELLAKISCVEVNSRGMRIAVMAEEPLSGPESRSQLSVNFYFLPYH